jgi:hypothetical protein
MGKLEQAIAVKSDQLNSDDLVTGPMTIKITDIGYYQDNGKTKILIRFDGDQGKPWKPCTTMARLMATVWEVPKDNDGSALIGHSLTVYRDAGVKWSGMAVGGIRISHMDAIDKDRVEMVTITRGKKEAMIIKPLKVATVTPIAPAPDKAAEYTAKLIAKLSAMDTQESAQAALQDPQVAKRMDQLSGSRPELVMQVQRAIDALPFADQEQAPLSIAALLILLDGAETEEDAQDVMIRPEVESLDAESMTKLSERYRATVARVSA